MNNTKRCLRAAFGAISMLLVAGAALAEEPPEAEPRRLSGTLNFDFDTNFMSYGFDVWQRGTFHQVLFHPSAQLNWDLGKGFNVFIGTWWDVNDNARSDISDRIQEIDVWGGVGYSWEKLSLSLTYQEWMYGGGSERIVDLGVAYDVFLSPSLIVHGRVDGNGDQEEGVVFVLGLGHTFEGLPYSSSLSFPLNVGFVTEDYYQEDEGGFGYVSFGPQLSIPIGFIPETYGSWSFNTGLTYYYTDPDNIDNSADHILTGKAGISLGF